MKSRVYTLLNKFLKGKATREEVNMIEAFEKQQLNKNEKNIFSNKLEKQHVEDEMFSNIAAGTFNKNNWEWLQIAASIAIIFGVGFGYYQINHKIETFGVCNTTSNIKRIHLIDGSEIVLNSGSSIKYTDDFNRDDRQVELEGEAFFYVARNEEKPFIITTGELKTKVLGTSFNIKQTESIVKVTVSTGLVQVYDKHNIIRIRPNQEAIYHTKTNDLNKRNIKSELITSWFAENIELTNISMSELSELLKKRFNVDLVFKDINLANKRLTITIKKTDNLDEIIYRINEINELILEKQGNNKVEVKENN
jgi:ferric-dicitrate binding protein FerR (iron transport regulator)